MGKEARLVGTSSAEHPQALRLWLRLLTCTHLIEARVRATLRDMIRLGETNTWVFPIEGGELAGACLIIPAGFVSELPGDTIEDERSFRELSRTFLAAAQETDVATVAVKYAELGLRALTVASAMGERRVSSWLAEKRQAEVRAITSASPRAKKK